MTQNRVSGAARDQSADSLTHLLGGRGSAIDASIPPLAFGVGWMLAGQSILVGGTAAILASAVIAVLRWRAGARPRAVVISLFVVMLGVLVALRTGNAADFFLIRLATNAVSVLGWLASILLRWPLLGVVVGTLLGQRTHWRRDPDLLRGYGRASWVWVLQYVVRLVVFIPLWSINAVVPLAIAQVALTWPLVAICVPASWWVLRRSLPADHPGIRHPRAGG